MMMEAEECGTSDSRANSVYDTMKPAYNALSQYWKQTAVLGAAVGSIVVFGHLWVALGLGVFAAVATAGRWHCAKAPTCLRQAKTAEYDEECGGVPTKLSSTPEKEPPSTTADSSVTPLGSASYMELCQQIWAEVRKAETEAPTKVSNSRPEQHDDATGPTCWRGKETVKPSATKSKAAQWLAACQRAEIRLSSMDEVESDPTIQMKLEQQREDRVAGVEGIFVPRSWQAAKDSGPANNITEEASTVTRGLLPLSAQTYSGTLQACDSEASICATTARQVDTASSHSMKNGGRMSSFWGAVQNAWAVASDPDPTSTLVEVQERQNHVSKVRVTLQRLFTRNQQ